MCRCKICNRNFRKSAACALATVLLAKLSSGARNIRAASVRDSTEISDDASRLSSGTHQPIRQSVKKCPAPVQRASADHAFGKLRQIAHQSGHPKLEISNGQPDVRTAQRQHTASARRKTAVVGLAVGQQLIQQLRHVRQCHCARITYFRGQGDSRTSQESSRANSRPSRSS